jgi:branched-chain amino acid transport system ATP-binding protein
MLNIEGLWVKYGNVAALRGVTLDVGSGEIVTLIGANGAGKSTTINTVSGLIRANEGRIRFKNKFIEKLPPHEILKMGLAQVPEGRKIFPEMTVDENILLGCFIMESRVIADRKEYIYNLFPVLRDRGRQIGTSLSGGEQQMLAMARGLVTDPDLLMLDEPSLGLAPVIVEKIVETIIDTRQRGKTVLLVEQNAFLALELADSGYVLEMGSIVIQGGAKDLMHNQEVRRAYLGI